MNATKKIIQFAMQHRDETGLSHCQGGGRVMAKIKVFHGYMFPGNFRARGLPAQCACCTATTSKKHFKELTGVGTAYTSETGNPEQVALCLARPGVVFVNKNGVNYPYEWVELADYQATGEGEE